MVEPQQSERVEGTEPGHGPVGVCGGRAGVLRCFDHDHYCSGHDLEQHVDDILHDYLDNCRHDVDVDDDTAIWVHDPQRELDR